MGAHAVSGQLRSFRPPAVPLVTVDPYLSVWSMADELTGDTTKHWTGADMALGGMARIDDQVFRFAGPDPASVPAMAQTCLSVGPTRTVYRFEAAGIALDVTFVTPLLLDDLDIMARPASYVHLKVSSIDGHKHSVALYLDVSAEWVVNGPDQMVRWNTNRLSTAEPLTVLSMGSHAQPILQKSGDDLRIDWGYLYMVVAELAHDRTFIGFDRVAREVFARTGTLPAADDCRMPRRADDERPALACSMQLGKVGPRSVGRLVTIVYDDLYSVEYFRKKLRPYWRKDGDGVEDVIPRAVADFTELNQRCERFDRELLADAATVGGEDYSSIVALAYRQAIAAHKLVVNTDGRPLLFSKECYSGACMATVDVSYPSAPLFLLFNTQFLRALLDPVLDYAESSMWPHDFAPHDVGLYPLANGQVYGGGPDDLRMQMPVEESGNMLILMYALAYREGDAAFARRHWDTLATWAGYLKARGLDPENQLCTDDFAGHVAHNANLSVKAITGLACYSRLAEMLGKKRVAAEYRRTAEQMATKWKQMAAEGRHYRLAFDQPGTWSMKYNLVWDRIFGLDLFDPAIARAEVAHLKKRANVYGVPLDSRNTYTKSDWLVWTATLAGCESDFRDLIAPLRAFLHESVDRVPFSDWYDTSDGKVMGFRARSVVGGVFIRMLADRHLWHKWSSRAGGEL